MCRALKVLCAAPGREALDDLKRAATSAQWELIGGATTRDELVKQLDELRPDVVVVDASIGVAALRSRAARPGLQVVSLGQLDGADAQAASLEGVTAAVIGLPKRGGPVRI